MQATAWEFERIACHMRYSMFDDRSGGFMKLPNLDIKLWLSDPSAQEETKPHFITFSFTNHTLCHHYFNSSPSIQKYI